jgi:hypothetical protein
MSHQLIKQFYGLFSLCIILVLGLVGNSCYFEKVKSVYLMNF